MGEKKLTRFFIFFTVLVILAVIFVPGYVKLAKLRNKNQKLMQEIQRLKQANEKLEKEIGLLEEDKEYIEKMAREKLGLTKEGEIIYKIEGE
jgi:cell division protein FtsL